MKRAKSVTVFLLAVSAWILSAGVSMEREVVSVKDKIRMPDLGKTVRTEETGKTVKTKSQDQGVLSMENSLFIGDSRTVGLMEYGQLDEAYYFCCIGMSVFNVWEERVSVPNIGKVTLTDLLNNKEYERIYVMLGINELGYPFEDIVSEYGNLMELLQEREPDASIIVQANLHVTKSRSDSDTIYNNGMIDKLNQELEEFADHERVFYLDVNPLFDDENGALSSDKSGDDTHPYGKYYVEWAEWIVQQTAITLKEG